MPRILWDDDEDRFGRLDLFSSAPSDVTSAADPVRGEYPKLRKALNVGKRVLLEPVIPTSTVEKYVSKVPGASKPSEKLGIAGTLGALAAKTMFTPLGTKHKPTVVPPLSPAKAIAEGSGFVQPTPAEAAAWIGTAGLGAAITVPRKLKAAAKAAKIMEEIRDAEKLGKASQVAYPGFQVAEEAMRIAPKATEATRTLQSIKRERQALGRVGAKAAKGVIGDVAKADLTPELKDAARKAARIARIEANTVEPIKAVNTPIAQVAQALKTHSVANIILGRAEDAMRATAQATNRLSEQKALTRLANSLRGSSRTADKLAGKGESEFLEAVRVALSGKNKDEIGRKLARYIGDAEYRKVGTGSETLDTLGESVRGMLRRRHQAALETGVDAGHLENYFPQYNPRFNEALQTYKKSPDKGIEKLQKLYANTDQVAPDALEARSIMESEIKRRMSFRRDELFSFSPHLELSRELNLPDYLGDWRSKNFKSEEFVRALQTYNLESARRIGDAYHLGAKGEVFKKLMNDVTDPDLRTLISDYRERLLSPVKRTDLEKPINSLLAVLRTPTAMSKLGKASLSNVFQNAITTLPATVPVQGIGKAFRNFTKGMAEVAMPGTTQDAAYEWARKIGIAREEIVQDLAEIQAGQTGSKMLAKYMDFTLFSPVELANNVTAGRIGRMYGQELADLAWKDPKKRAAVAREVEHILDAQPENAKAFIQSAELGGKASVSPDLLDEIGAQIAYKTQFRFSPTHLPLAWLTPMGRTVFQFRSFSYNYGRFLQDEIIRPALKGDIGPLVALGFSSVASGHLTRLAKRAVQFQKIHEGGLINPEESVSEEKRAEGGSKMPMAKYLGLDNPNGVGWEIVNDAVAGTSFGFLADTAMGLLSPRDIDDQFAPAIQSADRLRKTVLGHGGPGGLLRVGLEEYAPSPFSIGQTVSRALKEGGTYDRPFLPPLVQGNKAMAGLPRSPENFGRSAVRSIERALPDLPSRRVEPDTTTTIAPRRRRTGRVVW